MWNLTNSVGAPLYACASPCFHRAVAFCDSPLFRAPRGYFTPPHSPRASLRPAVRSTQATTGLLSLSLAHDRIICSAQTAARLSLSLTHTSAAAPSLSLSRYSAAALYLTHSPRQPASWPSSSRSLSRRSCVACFCVGV